MSTNETQIPAHFNEVHFPSEYPITEKIPYARSLFVDREANPTILLAGETGSGKTTSIYEVIRVLDEEGVTIVTEPTRVATKGASNRMKELAPEGHQHNITHQVGGEKYGRRTRLTTATEGVALDDILDDPLLTGVDRIVIDEVHSEEVDTWQIMGLAFRAQEMRKVQGLPPLQIVLCSATLNKERITKVTGDVPQIEAKGRMFPVTQQFLTQEQKDQFMEYKGNREGTVFNYAKAAAHRAVKLLQIPGDHHDVLVFLPGMADIEAAIKEAQDILDDPNQVWEHGKPLLLPLAGSLSPQEQELAVYEDTQQPKIIFSTDVAEASLTPTRPVHVISSAMANISYYDGNTGFDELRRQYLSKRRLKQQEGRAGRIESGIWEVLLTQDEFNTVLQDEILPEIHRTNLDMFVLKLRAAGLKDPTKLRIPEHAASASYAIAEKNLLRIGAIDANGDITKDGLRIARDLPVSSVEWGKLILEGEKNGCAMEMITIAAFSSGKNIWNRPSLRADEADAAHAKFKNGKSDLITFLDIWDAYSDVYDRAYSQAIAYTERAYYRDREKFARSQATKAAKQWAHDNFLNGQVLGEVARTRDQVREKLNVKPKSQRARESVIERTALAALPWSISIKSGTDYYGNVRYKHSASAKEGLKIHPGSALARTEPDVILSTSLYTNPHGIDYVRTGHTIPLDVLAEIAPQMIDKVESSIIENQQMEEVELRIYHIKTADGVVKVQKEFPLTPAQQLDIEAHDLATRPAVYDFQTHNNELMTAVYQILLRDNRTPTKQELEKMLGDWYLQIAKHFSTVHAFREALQTGQNDNLRAKLTDFIDLETIESIQRNNPDYYMLGDVEIPLHYEIQNGAVGISMVVTPEQALSMTTWPDFPSHKKVLISVFTSQGYVIQNAASLEQMQTAVSSSVIERKWIEYKEATGIDTTHSLEEALELQPVAYAQHPITGEALLAYPKIEITQTGTRVTYTTSLEEAKQAKTVVDAHIVEYKAQEIERVQLLADWKAIQAPDAWKYADTLMPNAGELPSEELYLLIKSTIDNNGDIITQKGAIRLLQQRIKDGKGIEDLLETLKVRSTYDPHAEERAKQEDERKRLLLDQRIQDSLEKILNGEETVLTDTELLDAWKKHKSLRAKVKNDLLTILTMKGPAFLLKSERALEAMPALLTEYRTRIRSTQDDTMRARHKFVLQKLTFMNTIISMMAEYGITGTQNNQEFTRVLHEVMRGKTVAELENTEAIFNEVVEKATFS